MTIDNIINAVIVEDQAPAQRILSRYIDTTAHIKVSKIFNNPSEAILYLNQNDVDVIFLDIHMPEMSGMALLSQLKRCPKIIFTTAYKEYAIESFEYNVVDYLLKPISYERFQKSIKKLTELHQDTSPQQLENEDIVIKTGYTHIKINIKDILFIKSDADYTEIITLQKKIISSEPLKKWVDTLQSHQFIRIHKSYVVNTFNITKVSSKEVYLQGKHSIPIGRAYKHSFMQSFTKI